MTLSPSLTAQIVASAPDAIITVDHADMITSWNQAAELIYGWSCAEALGRPLSELVPTSHFPPETPGGALARVQRQGAWLGHVRQIRRDGAQIHIHSAMSLLRDAAGQPQGLVAVNRDVTDHARRDQAPSPEQGQPSLPVSRDGIWQWDILNGLMTFSARMHELLDRPPERQIELNQTILQAVHPDDYERVTRTLRAHLEQRQPFSTELRLLTGAGAYRWFLTRGQARWDDQGRPIAMTGSLTDIDEIRHARQTLEELNRTLEARVIERTAELQQSLHMVEGITAATPDLLYIYDLARCQFVYANRSILTMLGYRGAQREALKGRVLIDLIHRNDAAKVEAHMGRVAVLADGAVAEFEYRLRDAAGMWRWFFGRELVFQRDEHGQPALILGVGSDVTMRKQTDAALRQAYNELSVANAQLARASRLKDEFLANMSHELRTPLNAILGRAESLLEAIHGPLTRPQAYAITSIEESGRHLLELINDILDLSKIEADRLYLELAPLSVAELCESCLRLVSPAAHKQGLTLRLSVSDPMPPVITDARRLKQILLNLLANAIKFTPAGGRVQLEVTWLPAQAQITFMVHDSGIGIAESDMDLLFQPFVQIDSGLQRQFPGTGLGLALVARLADLLGGSVGVRSQPGQGSRFSLTLAAAEAKELPVSTPAPTAGAALQLLLAEGRSPQITRTEAALASAGYQVRIAHDGEECLRSALETRPDLMVVKLQLPRLSGIDLIRRLRADPGLATVPLIALTALDRPSDEERCRAAGASRYLRQPLADRLLYQLINELL